MLARSCPARTARSETSCAPASSRPPRPSAISWERLPAGEQVISEVGGRPAYPGAAAEYYERNGADASLEVNEVVGGEPRTVVPAGARATVSLRLAPGQRAAEIAPCSSGCCATLRPRTPT